uniref:SAM domain-containing protein n=1 Tax=Amphimedon queenslandica TaxID=400682 RepID=A0A1X7SZH4_AMPQE
LTSSTKTIPTTSVAKTTSNKSGAPASNRRRGPNDLPVDVSKWSIGDVKKFFESKPDCQPVLSLLEDQEIDGQALLLLSQDTMVKCLNIKLGPALKIMAHVDQLKQQQATHT